MEKSFSTKIGVYDATFAMEGPILHITLKSILKMAILFAHYSPDSLPNNDFVSSPAGLYNLILILKEE